ncbi:hypothetical protein KEM55_000427, partial [Ascosphaera atra]
NMFLAAAVYFKQRFAANTWITSNYQSSILTVYCATNLASTMHLARHQNRDAYPKRILHSLLLNLAVFVLLAFSTLFFTDVSAEQYFVFVLLMDFGTSLAAGMCQNGLFSYVGRFAQPQYTQGIMAGQAAAGVMPCLVQIVAVLAAPSRVTTDPGEDRSNDDGQSAESACTFFVIAALVSLWALGSFLYLDRRQTARSVSSEVSHMFEHDVGPEKHVPMGYLFNRLKWLALGIFLDFAVTMFFPVYTAEIESVHMRHDGREGEVPDCLRPAAFVPMALLLWNMGDLLGRLAPGAPRLNIGHQPFALFAISVCRIIFVPLYKASNVHGRGAVIPSDVFYLLFVQFPFGLSNGYIAGSTMMAAGDWVEEDERDAAGGFMSVMLIGGLTFGSLVTFLVEP